MPGSTIDYSIDSSIDQYLRKRRTNVAQSLTAHIAATEQELLMSALSKDSAPQLSNVSDESEDTSPSPADGDQQGDRGANISSRPQEGEKTDTKPSPKTVVFISTQTSAQQAAPAPASGPYSKFLMTQIQPETSDAVRVRQQEDADMEASSFEVSLPSFNSMKEDSVDERAFTSPEIEKRVNVEDEITCPITDQKMTLIEESPLALTFDDVVAQSLRNADAAISEAAAACSPTAVVLTNASMDKPAAASRPTTVVLTDAAFEESASPSRPTTVVLMDAAVHKAAAASSPTTVVFMDAALDEAAAPSIPMTVVSPDVAVQKAAASASSPTTAALTDTTINEAAPRPATVVLTDAVAKEAAATSSPTMVELPDAIMNEAPVARLTTVILTFDAEPAFMLDIKPKSEPNEMQKELPKKTALPVTNWNEVNVDAIQEEIRFVVDAPQDIFDASTLAVGEAEEYQDFFESGCAPFSEAMEPAKEGMARVKLLLKDVADLFQKVDEETTDGAIADAFVPATEEARLLLQQGGSGLAQAIEPASQEAKMMLTEAVEFLFPPFNNPSQNLPPKVEAP